MKSLIQALAIAVVFAAPVASFAQSSSQPAAQDTQAVEAQSTDQAHAVQAANSGVGSGYGSGGHGTWQAGSTHETTISSYSPPIYNAR